MFGGFFWNFFFQSYNLLIFRKLYFKQKMNLMGVYRLFSYLKILQLSVGGFSVSYEVYGLFDFKCLYEKGVINVMCL